MNCFEIFCDALSKPHSSMPNRLLFHGVRGGRAVVMLVTMSVLVGCHQPATVPVNPPAPTALSLEQWRKLPIAEKYDEASFERLKLNDPKLKSERAWRAFMVKEIMPERRKDIPTEQPKS